MNEKKKRGRPPEGVPKERAESLLQWITEGKSLLSWSRELGNNSPGTVYLWIDKDPVFAERYARAREIGYQVIEQQIHDIADSPLMGEEIETAADGGVKIKRGDMLGHRKLQIETRLKLLAIWNPAKYSERKQIEHSGKIGLESLIAGDD